MLDQARAYANRKGIQLLPASSFKFTSSMRDSLSRWLPVKGDRANAFLDEVEGIAKDYLTSKLRRKGALSPAELKELLLKIRRDALNILYSFQQLGLFERNHSGTRDDVEAYLYLKYMEASPSIEHPLHEIVGKIVLLIEDIDSALSLDAETINARLQEPQSRGIPLAMIKGWIVLEFMKQKVERLTPKRGRPVKEDERQLIRRIAIKYETRFGKLPPSSPTSHFVSFITELFYILSPDSEQTDYTRLILDVLQKLRHHSA